MSNKIDIIFETLLGALQSAEKRHRVIYEKASDNNDWETVDRVLKIIPNITNWRRNIDALRSEIVASGIIAVDDIPNTDILFERQEQLSILFDDIIELNETAKNDDDIKVGKYIRNKLQELSRSGFIFTHEQILEMCDVEWSKKTFSYDRLLPFAKLADIERDISEQIKDEKGNNRYWNEIFTFNENNLLIISQWYKKDKSSFDKWYESITLLPDKQENLTDIIAENIQTAFIESDKPNQIIKPTKFILFGKEYIVTDWNEIFVKICEIMLLHRPYIIATMDKSTEFNTERQINFSYIQSEIKYNGKCLSNGLWLETNQNSNEIMGICHRLLEKCGFTSDELKIESAEG